MIAHIFDARGRHDSRLSGEMDLGVRNDAPDGLHLCNIGHDKGISTCGVGLARKVQRRSKFVFAQVDVACHVHAHTVCMRQAHRTRKLDGLDVFCARTGIESTKPTVDGIGTRGNGRKKRINRARRG